MHSLPLFRRVFFIRADLDFSANSEHSRHRRTDERPYLIKPIVCTPFPLDISSSMFLGEITAAAPFNAASLVIIQSIITFHVSSCEIKNIE